MFIGRRLIHATRLGPVLTSHHQQQLFSTSEQFKPVTRRGDMAGRARTDPIVRRLDSEQFQSIFSDSLHELIAIFKRNNHELRIAGGAVRDLLLDKTPTDVDFATTATPSEMKAMFEAENVRLVNTNGEKHGTVTPRINNAQFEVTTLRIDTATNGRHAEVEFTTDWQEDANRRDLTINSMFLDLDGHVYDWFFGYDDLQRRRVAFVGDPSQRIQEDYLRILRYFRFYGRIAQAPDEHDAATLLAITANIAGLARISGERIWSELKKILQGRFAGELLIEMLKCGAAEHIGLPADPDTEQFRRVCQANDSCVEAGLPPLNPIAMLSGLLGNADDAFELHQRLKLSAFERDLAKFITVNRSDTATGNRNLLYYQCECFNTLGSPALQRTMIVELLKYNRQLELARELLHWQIPVYPMTGDILRAHDCPGGSDMGIVQRLLREQWKASGFRLTQSELLDRLPDAIAEMRAMPTPPKRQKPGGKAARAAVAGS